ncbi:MotA/TolQ/ExbB proton channel family protein [Catenovulum maritimum]|uniref:Energy transducer TonB n=1 Tax=Catenovulum maritimum TaxID=1513271 RepID=A0A0J8GP97_9ALTE|nr:MotA/TolQ/ExbB proton channel family protein [Catenovulum maritimum]KMT64597.1 energy transducer TonB [Catenovulum maritimum]
MKNLIKGLITSAALTFTLTANAATESNALNLDQLLNQLEQGKLFQNEQNQQREAEFLAKKGEQVKLLEQAIARRDAELRLSDKLETQAENNDQTIKDLEASYDNRLGSLKELLGELQRTAGDAKGSLESSIISAQYPNRHQFLGDLAQKIGGSSKLTSIDEIERFWFELQREMTESGKIVSFKAPVIEAETGAKVEKEVVRVGSFNLVSDGKFLDYSIETGSLSELARQPAARHLDTAAAIQSNAEGFVQFSLDPTAGSILGLLVQAPNMQERVEQGGTVGYIILAVGLVGLLIALERFISLSIVGAKIKSQLKNISTPKANNPLGRVLSVKDQHPTADTETFELKLSEAILREVPKLQRNLTFIKIISVVAPLMGLLGTVTGMINTFQAITLFGTGDPKLMAGGISQALVTTVLGLVVAIPTLLLYTMLNTRSRGLVSILQEQSTGLIAERAEKAAE